SYVLIAQMLYQATLADALQEVERAQHAGWFVIVLGDAKGNLAVVEGTPEKLLVRRPRGHVGRASYASRDILGGETHKMHPQCKRIIELLDEGKGRYDEATLKGYFADHKCPLCIHPSPKRGFTVDSMLFNCNTREAHVTRGPVCTGRWRT